MENPAPGILLIADPFLKDQHFSRTVILLCEHKENGSLGFVINRQLEHRLEDLLAGAKGLKIPIFFGGPVQMDTLHFLHMYPNLIPGSRQLSDGIYWGGDFEIALSLLQNGDIDPHLIRFYIGYSGWTGGQLDEELKGKSWLTAQARRKVVFHPQLDEIWKEAIRLLSSEYQLMANFPIDPQLN
jgi:putative transcriptional regulator